MRGVEVGKEYFLQKQINIKIIFKLTDISIE